jgi:hypothetical protein
LDTLKYFRVTELISIWSIYPMLNIK